MIALLPSSAQCSVYDEELCQIAMRTKNDVGDSSRQRVVHQWSTVRNLICDKLLLTNRQAPVTEPLQPSKDSDVNRLEEAIYRLLDACNLMPQRRTRLQTVLRIPRRYSHFLFAVMQSALTSAIAAGIASVSLIRQGTFLLHWLESWLFAWLLMLPVVVIFAPLLNKFADLITKTDQSDAEGAASEQ
jgi:Protein of unknown function (DUF2798)